MPLKPGTKKEAPPNHQGYENSMAEAMEKAFFDMWPQSMGNQPAPESNDQFRLMFLAIANGVVKHLKDNADSFSVTVGSGSGTVSSIETDPGTLP